MKRTEFRSYPDPLASESVKASKEYGMRYFQAMYRDWAGENEVSLEQRRMRWQLARNYAGGKQSTEKYKDLLQVEGDESYLNLDWSVVPIIPKFVDIVVNSLTNAEYNIKATAIDSVATDKRKADELAIRIGNLNADFYKEIETLTGMPMSGNKEERPTNNEEIDLFMQLTYKQAAEIAIEQGLTLAMTINDWTELSRRVIRDLAVIGIGAVKTELDHRGVILRYVDPMYLVTSYSERPDYTDLSHAGEIRRVTLSALKAEFGTQLTEPEWQHVAKTVAGKHGNSAKFRIIPTISNGVQYYDYDNFLVDVMDAQFITPDKLVYEKKANKYGGYSVNKKKDDYRAPKKSKYQRDLLQTTFECKYSGKWILGTPYLCDYGRAKNQLRTKSALHKTRLDYIIYAPDMDFMKNQSLCERMVTFADQIQLVHLKLQHLCAKARPKGLAMELGSMESVQDGKGGTFKVLDLQDIYDQTGNFYYRQQSDDGSMSNPRPITELEGGVGSSLQELLTLYNHNLNMIRDVSGVNEVRDGSVPNKDSVVGVAKLNLLASNNATRAVNDAFLNIFRRTAESCILMIQDLVQYHKPYQGYVRAIGKMNMEAINITKDVSIHEFGILIEPEPTGADKEALERDIQQSIAQKELRLEDGMMIRRIKNIKMAEQMLKLKRKQYQAEQAEMAAANSRANTEQAQIALQQKNAADIELDNKKTENKIRFLQAETQAKDMLAEKQHVREMELQELENEGKVEVSQNTSADNM
jgi:hypothetical protein